MVWVIYLSDWFKKLRLMLLAEVFVYLIAGKGELVKFEARLNFRQRFSENDKGGVDTIVQPYEKVASPEFDPRLH